MVAADSPTGSRAKPTCRVGEEAEAEEVTDAELAEVEEEEEADSLDSAAIVAGRTTNGTIEPERAEAANEEGGDSDMKTGELRSGAGVYTQPRGGGEEVMEAPPPPS